MTFNSEWIGCKGTFINENRDHCAVALRGNETLHCVVDGSTRAFQSGKLASTFVKDLADRFVVQPIINSAEDIKSLLKELSESLETSYSAGRFSFLILLDLGDGFAATLHAGDCRIRN